MHVLVTEARPGDCTQLVSIPHEVGCQVSTCHDGSRACTALEPGRRCPLDGSDSATMVVDVRGAGDELTAREFGVVCGMRAGRQVVLVDVERDRAPTVPVGLSPYTTAVRMRSLVEACADGLRTQHVLRTQHCG